MCIKGCLYGICLGELRRYIGFELPCHITEGSTKHLFRKYKICAEQGWYKATSPSFSLENKMFFTVLSAGLCLPALMNKQHVVIPPYHKVAAW